MKSASSSLSGVAAAPAASSSGSEDACRVTVVSASCARERSCSECLSAEVRPDGCFLDASVGVCRAFSQLTLSPAASRDLNSSSTPAAKWQALESAAVFASLGARAYCDRLDSACVLCARAANSAETFAPTAAELSTMSADHRVCFGAGGCVCVAACESVERMSYTSKRCPGEPGPEPVASAAQSEHTPFPSAQMLALLIVTAFLLVRCVSECFRERLARQRELLTGEPDASDGASSSNQPTTSQQRRRQQRRQPRQRQRSDLQLTGWIAWHRELREMERRGELGYVELETPKPEGDESGLRTAADSASSASMLMVTWAPRNAL